MTWQQFQLRDIGVRADEVRHGTDMGLIVIDPANQRDAGNKANLWKSSIGALIIFEDVPVICTGKGAMLRPISELEIMQHDIHMGQHHRHERPGYIACSFNRRMEAALARRS